jgi:hypothetical protein
MRKNSLRHEESLPTGTAPGSARRTLPDNQDSSNLRTENTLPSVRSLGREIPQPSTSSRSQHRARSDSSQRLSPPGHAVSSPRSPSIAGVGAKEPVPDSTEWFPVNQKTGSGSSRHLMDPMEDHPRRYSGQSVQNSDKGEASFVQRRCMIQPPMSQQHPHHSESPSLSTPSPSLIYSSFLSLSLVCSDCALRAT